MPIVQAQLEKSLVRLKAGALRGRAGFSVSRTLVVRFHLVGRARLRGRRCC
jgi:hypothetical protein